MTQAGDKIWLVVDWCKHQLVVCSQNMKEFQQACLVWRNKAQKMLVLLTKTMSGLVDWWKQMGRLEYKIWQELTPNLKWNTDKINQLKCFLVPFKNNTTDTVMPLQNLLSSLQHASPEKKKVQKERQLPMNGLLAKTNQTGSHQCSLTTATCISSCQSHSHYM